MAFTDNRQAFRVKTWERSHVHEKDRGLLEILWQFTEQRSLLEY